MENDTPVIEALIAAFLLLEQSGPEDLNPDVALRGMENMTWSLLQLSKADQLILRKRLDAVAADATDPAYRSFVLALPDMIGLAPVG